MQPVKKLLKPLFGTPCWRIEYDVQLGLDLSFGSPYVEIREPYESKSKSEAIRQLSASRLAHVKASVWLWIRLAHWAIALSDGRRATRGTSAKGRAIAFAVLQGEKVIDIAIDSRTGKTTFSFDLGGVLQVKRFRKVDGDELWTLYKPNGYCFSVRSDGHYTHHPCSESSEVWNRL